CWEEGKNVNPPVIGRLRMYGSVNENWNDRWRFPAARLIDSTSPRPNKLLVEYSSPKNDPPIPEIPPLNDICWRPFSWTFTVTSTRPSSSLVRKSASLSLSIGLN